MASVSELAASAADIRLRSKDLDVQIKTLKRNAKLVSVLPPPTPWMRRVAAHIVFLSDGSTDVALEYLATKKRWASEGEVRGWHDGMPASERRNLTSPPPDEPRSARQLAEARRFVAEKKLVAWVKQQNEERGLAPSPGVVLDHAPVELELSGRRNERRRRVRRIMGRWGGHRGIFAGGDRLPLEALQEKAPVARRHTQVRQNLRQAALFFGPPGGPVFWSPVVFDKKQSRKWDRQAVPFLRPGFKAEMGPGGGRGVCWRTTGRPGLVGGGATFWRLGSVPANACFMSTWMRLP